MSTISDNLVSAGSVAICGHVMPDGDCIGSTLALGLALRKMGKQIILLSPDPVPEMYNFLPGASLIQVGASRDMPFDIFMAVDCSVPERLGRHKMLLEKANRAIVLDHHTGSSVFGDIYLNEPEFAAAAEIVYDLLQLLPVDMDSDIATCLYVAIITDTGSFRYDNTRPQTHLRVAKLLERGIPASYINKKLYEEKPLTSFKVLGVVLQSLNISDCGRVAWMSASRRMMDNLNASDEHIDGFINYPRMIKGVELALFFRELEEGKYKVSLRSKYYLDVNKLAAHFGGGGHIRAAGCIMEGNLAQVQKRMLEAAALALKDEKL